MRIVTMRIAAFFSLLFMLNPSISFSNPYNSSSMAPKQEFYSIRIYHLKTKDQEERVDKYLQTAFLPPLHRLGIPNVAVFIPASHHPSPLRPPYILLPLHSLS